MDLNKLTIAEAKEGLEGKKFSSAELTKACLDRIKEVEPKLNAFVTVTEKEALEQAKRSDDSLASQGDALRSWETKPLLGIPLSIKDNFCTRGIKTTASSKILENFIPPYDATVVKKLKDEGAIILGKTNMDAWAHGSSTETSDFGSTKNPWDLNRLPGGSSGGAAASVASDEALAGIGSETAGSIRQPASWCGTVGLKPTYGRVSRYGVVAMASSLDSPGPITKTVEDSAIILNVLAGIDPMDSTTSPKEQENYTKNLTKSIRGLKIGISNDYFKGVDNEIVEKVQQALKEFEKQGAIIKNVKLFDPQYAIAVYTILQRAEVSSNLARYDGIRYGQNRSHFGEEAKRRIMLGTYTLSAGYYDAYYKKAQQVRTLIVKDFEKAFEEIDIVLAPTSPTTALPVGSSKNSAMFGELADILVEPSSIAGLPGINVTCGFSKEKLPIGMQIIGPQFAENLILNAAYKYESVNNFHKEKPKL
ncbi:MAG: Asp-tRNA(Asn)/Glu-tRNA(Gln) amidotransferase subunit GatA [Candidatus Parcubacteria bacterium]|nr:Asp-tRNA(Asn)/Glu-tRNA(Gln) amidotransferase subunit GatA [Candidatus Parcubacteria bacterium]